MPRRLPDSMSWHVSGSAVRAKARRLRRGPGLAAGAGANQSARARLLERRRRALGILGATVVLSALLTVAGALPSLVQLLCDLALVGYLLHLRTQARRKVAYRTPLGAGHFREDEGVRPSRPATRVPVEVDAADLAPAVGYGPSWDPVPVPPPIYVTQSQVGSPDAPQQEGDLSKAGASMIEELGLWDDDTTEFDFVTEDEPLEHRRAVND